MKKFKTKKKVNTFVIYFAFFIVSVGLTTSYLYKANLVDEDTFIDNIINDNLGLYDNKMTNVDFLLKYFLDIELTSFDKDEANVEEVNMEIKKPIVYIYNTHQEEKYLNGIVQNFNVSSTVLLASKILKEYLKELGIEVIVEESNITSTLHSMNLKYGSSYKVSRMFLEKAKEDNPSLNYFIDIHRDSSKYEETTTEFDGKKYARLLFVVGLDNEDYQKNLVLVEKLKEKIKSFNENLFRGVMQKSGKGVNGVYNQDFHENVILIEVGGQYNTISEINNTLKVLADILYKQIKEDESV